MILRVPVTFANVTEWARKIANAVNALIDGQGQFTRLDADPSNPNPGYTYYNTSTNKLRLWDGSTWTSLN